MTVPRDAWAWAIVGTATNLTAAIAAVTLALWLWQRRGRFGGAGGAIVAALALTALSCLADAAGASSPALEHLASLAESLRNIGWFFVIYRFFASDGRPGSLGPIRPVIAVIALVELLHLGVDYSLSDAALSPAMERVAFDFAVMVRLLATIGALVLVHNLYAGAPREGRPELRWPACGLAALWAFDLNLYTLAYLTGHKAQEIVAVRGAAVLALAACIAIGTARNRNSLRLRPSRAVTFQTASLLVIGAYLIAMVGVTQWLAYAGGDFARLMELTFLTIASAIALVVLPSGRLRRRIRITVSKHLFQHRYDYREEWLRFTRTIGSGGGSAPPLGERVVKSLADVFASPAGLLLWTGEHGDVALGARWNWDDIEVPATAFPASALQPLEQIGPVVDLDDLRAGGSARALSLPLPDWLGGDPRAWAMVPLLHFDRLVGVVVLARPPEVRKFDWEDFDLLRVIGQQAASYLAEQAGQDSLAEASRFDDFHRRIAFVMHDIKNLASQFSLLARNAELHADKPAFRADMLVTLRNSSDKLNALLARLSRYGSAGGERLETVAVDELLAGVNDRFADEPGLAISLRGAPSVTGNRHSLEQVLVHLVQNAIDAGPPGSPVMVSFTTEGGFGRFEVADCGCGMSADFVRTRLFKPFVSTKPGGFGIGAFEARELVQAMRGRLEVESREGIGSRFIVRVPLALAAGPGAGAADQQEVA